MPTAHEKLELFQKAVEHSKEKTPAPKESTPKDSRLSRLYK